MLFSFSGMGWLIQGLCLFLQEMTENEKTANHYNWDSDEGDNPDSHPEGMVHMVVDQKNHGGKSDPENCQNNPSHQFPLPGKDQENNQYVGWDQVDQETADLLPQGQLRIEGIEREHADKKDGKDAQDPGYPMNDLNLCFHISHLRMNGTTVAMTPVQTTTRMKRLYLTL